LHKLPAFFGLMDCVSAAVKDVLGFLKIGNDAFSVTGCWANVAAPGGWHRMHSHPNNFLSGVYYVRSRRARTPSISTIRGRRPASSGRR